MTVMRFEAGSRRLQADFAKPLSIAIPMNFQGPQPACFDAPPATATALRAGDFVGDMRKGGTCNCELLTLAPHCNGTHTECVGHVTDARVAIADRLRGGVSLSLLISVPASDAGDLQEDSDPLPQPGDRLITAAALAASFARHPGPAPTALVVRTLMAGQGPIQAYRGPSPAPYLSRQAAAWLVEHGIEHLVLDLPSADRAADGGRLTAHRIFFGLPPGSKDAQAAARPRASITELAWIAPAIEDGFYLLDLQIPPFLTDAAPSRPLLYAIRAE